MAEGRCLEANLKCFHFQEKDWIIAFQSSGNEGRKYLYYTVEFLNCNTGTSVKACLSEVIDSPEFEVSYPHTVGYFKAPSAVNSFVKGNYMEIRMVRCIEDFFKFLNDLNI